jgi:hypothetical protein
MRFCPLTGCSERSTFATMEFDRTAVEQFIADYFRERTSALRLRLEVHHRFWQRFYDSQCHWDSRRGVIEKSESPG